ncbi:WXG100 family type VII secretion target [Streptomyces sp. NPDC047046]|uniref:WXG100 family type VII secretion target n=1 Tax=Streptomyces sp. NPDC047046 TaxID=3155378 RepID=UPI0033C91DFB
MAQPDVLFDYDEIARVATTMGTKLSDISTELGDLETTVSGLLQDGLVFEKASPALQEAYQDFSNQMKTSAKNIQEYANTFNDIAKAIADSDGDIATGVKNAQSGNEG